MIFVVGISTLLVNNWISLYYWKITWLGGATYQPNYFFLSQDCSFQTWKTLHFLFPHSQKNPLLWTWSLYVIYQPYLWISLYYWKITWLGGVAYPWVIAGPSCWVAFNFISLRSLGEMVVDHVIAKVRDSDKGDMWLS